MTQQTIPNLHATPGGLFVAVSVLGVILYQSRTVLEFAGISLPILPYMLLITILMVGVYGWFAVTDRLVADPQTADQTVQKQ